MTYSCLRDSRLPALLMNDPAIYSPATLQGLCFLANTTLSLLLLSLLVLYCFRCLQTFCACHSLTTIYPSGSGLVASFPGRTSWNPSLPMPVWVRWLSWTFSCCTRMVSLLMPPFLIKSLWWARTVSYSSLESKWHVLNKYFWNR